MTELKPLLDYVGGLGGTAVIILVSWAVWTKRLLLPREQADRDAAYARDLANKDERIADLRAQLAKQEADLRADLAKEEAEKVEWKQAAQANRSLAHKATDAVTTFAANQPAGPGVPS